MSTIFLSHHQRERGQKRVRMDMRGSVREFRSNLEFEVTSAFYICIEDNPPLLSAERC